MNEEQIQAILDECERRLASSGPVDLGGLGFWKAVAAVKRQPALVDRYAARIAAIDQQAFGRAVWLRFPVTLGIAVEGLATVVGVILVVLSVFTRRRRGELLVAGTGILLVSTHDLAHFLVGRAVGIRFTNFFLGGKLLIEPGLKVDQQSYLHTPARQRALMHASGAIVTQAIPFLALGIALAAPARRWVLIALAGLAAAITMTEVFFSTRYSDWRRFRREMRVARNLVISG